MPRVTPTFTGQPELGKPGGMVEDGRRIDFKPGDFAFEIETKAPRLAWARAAECPCTSTNDQTDQPAIDCAWCKRKGVLYFRPRDYRVDESRIGFLTATQRNAIGANGVVIRGMFNSVSHRETLYNKLGRWTFGDTMVTVRPENRLGYYDRLTVLDAQVPFREVVEAGDKGAVSPRYPVISLNLAMSLDETTGKRTLYTEDDLELVDGAIRWRPGRAPKTGKRVSIHYQCHPVYVVLEHPNVFRVTLSRLPGVPDTPEGTYEELPLRAKVGLEFLPRETT